MKTKFLCLAVLFPVMCWGQKYDGICQNVTELGLKINELIFTTYKNNTFINEKYKSINEVTNSTPEELLKSQFSVTDNNWLSLNYEKKMNWTPAQFNKLNASDNKIELLCKLQITLDTLNFAIVKVNLYEKNGKAISMSLLMQKNKNNKWIISENKMFSNVNFIFMFLSIDDLYYIFNNKLLSDNEKVNEITKTNWINGIFDLSKTINELGSLLVNMDYKKQPAYYSIKIDNNLDFKIRTNSIISFTNQQFCYFFTNENSSFSDKIVSEVINEIKKQYIDVEIFPLVFVSYKDIIGQDIILFKYNSKINEVETNEIKQYLYKNDNFVELFNSNDFKNIFEKDVDIIKKYFSIE